jgi:two-component system sensor histidine kinase CpxA
MRSLYVRIFLWFWLAMTLVGAAGVIMTLTTDRQSPLRNRQAKQISGYGQRLIQAYEEGGPAAVSELAERLERKDRVRIFLFRGTRGPLSGRAAPPESMRIATLAARTGSPQLRPGKRGLIVTLPLEDDFVVMAELPRPSRVSRLLDPHNLVLRLLVTFIVAGVVCYILARSLTSPIRKLREATQQFAQGKLDTRVGPDLGAPGGEISDLACDFNDMAGRIEKLVESQHRLIRDISHELRSPLARLNVALGLARRSAGEDSRDSLDRIEQEAERLNDLIGELLSLSRMEEGERTLSRESVDLESLVKEIVKDADFEARNRARAVDLVSSEQIRTNGSREILRRAIENVVRNAVRYTREDTQVKITLQRRRDGESDSALLIVRDQGPGVPEGELPHLFRPFYRVANARERQTGGVGVGLAIAHRAVSLHGGTVTASNAHGGGLLVEITLPLVGSSA